MAKKIEYIEVDLSSTRKSTEKRLTIFLMHGYGADAYDLQSLAEVLDQGLNARWIFPQGIKSVPIGPGWMGRAWWEIAARDLEGQDTDRWTETVPSGILELRERMLSFISEIEPDWNQVVLGGFSQGAMLSLDLFFHSPQKPRGMVLLSGALVNKQGYKEVLKSRVGSQFFLCHGRQDQVLPYKCGSKIESFLLENGLKGSLMSFDGGHEIPMEVVQKAAAYLKNI